MSVHLEPPHSNESLNNTFILAIYATGTLTYYRGIEAQYMVQNQHLQATKEPSAFILLASLDAFTVLLDTDPVQRTAAEN